jgi:hypothetical protein
LRAQAKESEHPVCSNHRQSSPCLTLILAIAWSEPIQALGLPRERCILPTDLTDLPPAFVHVRIRHLLLPFRFEPGWGSATGKGRRLSPLPLAQMYRGALLCRRKLFSACGIPNCCAGAPRCTRSSTPRSSAAHRTSSGTNSRSNTLPATVRGNSRRARSASAGLLPRQLHQPRA